MKISKLKERIGLGDKWKCIKVENEYHFKYLNMQIHIIKKSNNYKVSILSHGGFISNEFENTEKVRTFIRKKIDI